MTTFNSGLSASIRSYLTLKRALGRQYTAEEWVLAHLDRFLAARCVDLTAETFAAWCLTLQHLASGTRRARMRIVRNLCLYRRRGEPGCFVPDERLFPPVHQAIRPHIFTDNEIVHLLAVARTLARSSKSPLRPENMRLAIVVLSTTGLRRGELTQLVVGDYDPPQRTLAIRESKFHKSRLVPLSADTAREIEHLIEIRDQRRLPTDADSPLLWHRSPDPGGYSRAGLSRAMRALFRRAGIRTATGHLPRTHDFRHGFAVNALLRWYRAGLDLQSKLPFLAAYMGHVSIVSTAYYLQFVEPLAVAASARFCRPLRRPRYGPPRRGRCAMTAAGPNDLARALRAFFAEHLPRVRGTSPHTIQSYRDSLVLLLRFVSTQTQRSVIQLDLDDLGPRLVLAFLQHLELDRHNSVATRNVRLAAIHAFFRYCALEYPARLAHCQRVLAVPFKRTGSRLVEYLEHEEIEAILGVVDRGTVDGRRDYALLATMFNTGARVQEIVVLCVADLRLDTPAQVRLHGKGRKERVCPLWPQTADLLRALLAERGRELQSDEPVFRNHRGARLTRFGVRYLLQKYCIHAPAAVPALRTKRLHPHSMRHSTAVHLLRAGVDIVTISHWLGHASVTTTHRYATVDLDMKRQALGKARPTTRATAGPARWRTDASVLEWLEAL